MEEPIHLIYRRFSINVFSIVIGNTRRDSAFIEEVLEPGRRNSSNDGITGFSSWNILKITAIIWWSRMDGWVEISYFDSANFREDDLRRMRRGKLVHRSME